METKTIWQIPMEDAAFPSASFVFFIEQLFAAQHDIFAMKMVWGWNFRVNVQGTSLSAVASGVPSVRVTS